VELATHFAFRRVDLRNLVMSPHLKGRPVSNLSPQDARGFFMLPQAPEQAGYYTYGMPGRGAAHYAHPSLISLICMIEHRWQSMEDRKFGIGNISVAGGAGMQDHRSHTSGLDVDVRLIRKDGRHAPVTRFDSQYDCDATARLIQLFFESRKVNVIYFNDISITGVKYLGGHDNHFHVALQQESI